MDQASNSSNFSIALSSAKTGEKESYSKVIKTKESHVNRLQNLPAYLCEQWHHLTGSFSGMQYQYYDYTLRPVKIPDVFLSKV